MSHKSKIFEEAPIKVPNRNGFDLSHLNIGTAKCGQLVPVLCKLLPPNSKFTLGAVMDVNLPPLATQFYGRIDAIIEGFIVPCSVLYAGWKQFIMNQQATEFPDSQTQVQADGGYVLPTFSPVHCAANNIGFFAQLMGTNDNIYEYFGCRQVNSLTAGGGTTFRMSMLPGLCYHLIVDKWYRNKQITKTWFEINPNWVANATAVLGDAGYPAKKNVSLIWHSWYTDHEYTDTGTASSRSVRTATGDFASTAELTFPDGTSFFSTRQRCYSRDYFTAAMPKAQQGNDSLLKFSVDLNTGDGTFSIASLRNANALQKFLETNGLSGDFADMMRNRWGVHPIDADFDEPYYLGRIVVPVYQKGVNQTAATYDSDTQDTRGANSQNPFVSSGLVGAEAAKGGFSGRGSICESFHNTTWAYLMCLFSLVPHAMYGYGLNRELLATKLEDFPAPELQTIGNEDIKCFELLFDQNSVIPGSMSLQPVFGYIPRYSRFKYMDDEVHGEMRPGKTLESFVLQRRITPDPVTNLVKLSTAFVEIPQNALDSVFAVSTASMKLSCWYEIFFEFKCSMPLADFCVPTLGEIPDTHTIKTSIGGSRL